MRPAAHVARYPEKDVKPLDIRCCEISGETREYSAKLNGKNNDKNLNTAAVHDDS